MAARGTLEAQTSEQDDDDVGAQHPAGTSGGEGMHRPMALDEADGQAAAVAPELGATVADGARGAESTSGNPEISADDTMQEDDAHKTTSPAGAIDGDGEAGGSDPSAPMDEDQRGAAGQTGDGDGGEEVAMAEAARPADLAAR